jgi:DNA-binding transcriptional regulator YbjK
MESAPIKRRSKGEQTRNLILESAIEILAAQGIKGTTHRAIASHAKIQLSLTTYYFKDIQELVHQAFILNSSKTITLSTIAWQQAFILLEETNKTMLRKVAFKEDIRSQLTEMATQYLHYKITEERTALAVEQLMFTEIQVSPQLRALAENHRKELLTPFLNLCRYFNKSDAHLDADIMLTVFTQLEYRNLSIPITDLDVDYIRAMVNKVLGSTMKLKN